MIANYYTLFHIATELECEFARQTINEIFTQHRNELVISFKDIPAAIIIGCEPANNYIYARRTFTRARRNSANIFNGLIGSKIEKIFIHPTDRQVHIRLKTDQELIVQLFGSKANVLLLNTDRIITDTFLKKSDMNVTGNKPVQAESESMTPNFFTSAHAEGQLAIALKHIFPQFGPVLVRELLARVNLNGELKVNTFLKNEITRLLDTATRMKKELLASPSPCVYYDGTLPIRFSIIPLRHLSDFKIQNFNSLSEAIQTYRAGLFNEKSFLEKKEEIVRVMEHEYERSKHALHKIAEEGDKPNLAKQYELFGKLLISQLHLLKKGDTAAVVENFVDGSGDIIEVPLDPHLTPAKNAERYFEKSEKSRHASEEQHHRIAELTRRQKSISSLLEQMEEITTNEELKDFTEENKNALSQFGLKTKKSGQTKKEEPLPFRVFTVEGGFQVWAGKSSENNDLLSTRHTAKNDLWFHARSIGGSHVVLKIGTGKGEVSKKAIEQAAAIAAYYSKMKKSKLVPVTMCEGKYVRKPKGAPAGTVTVEREKTIFAEPKLPLSQ